MNINKIIADLEADIASVKRALEEDVTQVGGRNFLVAVPPPEPGDEEQFSRATDPNVIWPRIGCPCCRKKKK